MHNVAIILAGGNGNRLWPISKPEKPKQFLKLCGNEIMINETIKRIYPIFEYNNIFIVINKKQKELAYKYIDFRIPRNNIIIEPEAKNTAMSVFFAITKIKKIIGESIVTTLSSDHYIKNIINFRKDIKSTIDLANKYNNLVSIGIKPTSPSTEFGYIKYKEANEKFYLVERFIEKPNLKKAKEFFKSKRFFWNTGILSVRLDVLLEQYKKYLPELYEYYNILFDTVNTDYEINTVNSIYKNINSVSIDTGILEKCDVSDNLKVIKATFNWKDIGTLKNFFDIHKKIYKENSIIGKIELEKTENCNLYSDEQTRIVTIGIRDITVIKNGDICVICSNKYLDDIKKYI